MSEKCYFDDKKRYLHAFPTFYPESRKMEVNVVRFYVRHKNLRIFLNARRITFTFTFLRQKNSIYKPIDTNTAAQTAILRDNS